MRSDARPRRWSVMLRFALAVALLALSFGARGQGSDVGASWFDGDLLSKRRGRFLISGNAEGLFPGGTRTIDVRVQNPNKFAIRVVSLSVAVGGDSSHPGCGPASVTASSWSGALTLKKRRTVTLPAALSLTMAGGAADACQGATFPLTFSGSATGKVRKR